MSRKTAHLSTALDPSERRRLPRKRVFLSGVLADLDGESATECTIRDIHARGAEIAVPARLPIGARVYLLDTGNRMGHLACVAWSRPDRCGLSFVRSLAMGLGLPPRMRFLWRHLIEAQLRQVDRAVAMGVPVELALSTAGVTREQVHQMARYAGTDKRLASLLRRAIGLLDE